MLPTRLISVFLILCSLLLPVASRAEEPECAIVYGSKWAFLFATPNGWSVVCPVNDPSGINVALWPGGTSWENAPGVMYVTVSHKGDFSLAQFAADDLARFRKQSPKLRVHVAQPILRRDKTQALVRELTGDEYGNHEVVAYVDAKTVYLTVVLTSRMVKEYVRFRPVFREFVSSLAPMEFKFQDGEEPPSPAAEKDAPPAMPSASPPLIETP